MAKQKILLALFLLGSTYLFSQSKVAFDNEAITKILYQYVNDDTPGMAVGILKDGKVVYEKYIGYANLDSKVKVDKNTRFNIASNTKQFTALCVLKLIEEGKISLEDDIKKYLPDVLKNIGQRITILHLITHTSGIRDYCDLLALQGRTWWKQFIDNRDVIKLLQNQRGLNFEPGSKYGYSNSNYILLTEIIKKVTNQDFSEFAKTVFEKLEMSSTHFLTHYGTIIPQKARPYGNWNGWKEEPAITEVHGDGALFTTLRDQLKWEQIVQDNNGEYLTKTLINSSQSLIESSLIKNYGYGLMFDTYQKLDYTYHDGVTGAYNATFLRFPTENISIVIISNNRNVPANYLAWQITFLILELEPPVKKTTYPDKPDETEELERIQDILGIYKSEEDETIIKIIEKNDTLYRAIYQRAPAKLLPKKNGLFEYEKIKGLKINFTNIGKAEQKFTLYMSSQKPSTYHKISDLSMNNFDKSELNGHFYNGETDTEIILKFIKNNTYSLIKNGRERKAELISEDYLRMMDTYKIKVIRNKKDEVVGLNVNNRRIENVIFTKK